MAKSLAQLEKQIATLRRQADQIKAKETQDVVARIRDAIDHYGLTAADLGFAPKPARKGRAPAADASAPASKKTAKAARRRSALPPKFKDAEGRTWNGHGRRPQWFVAALAAGKTAEDLAI